MRGPSSSHPVDLKSEKCKTPYSDRALKKNCSSFFSFFSSHQILKTTTTTTTTNSHVSCRYICLIPSPWDVHS